MSIEQTELWVEAIKYCAIWFAFAYVIGNLFRS